MERRTRKKDYLKTLCFPFCLLCLLAFGYLANADLNNAKPTSSKLEPADMRVYQQSGFKVFGQEVETNLDIFSISDFNNEKLVYPNSEGVYTFLVKNNSYGNNLPYSLKIQAENPHNIPIMISLEKNGKSIYDMKFLTKADFNDNLLAEQEKDTYTLRWMWDDKDNNMDTILGNNKSKFYTMTISAVGTMDETKAIPPLIPNILTPTTGDVASLSIIMIIGASIFLILLFKRRKKENDEKEQKI